MDLSSQTQLLATALEEIQANIHDLQSVYTCVVRMYDILQDDSQPQRMVDTVLAPLSRVNLLQELIHLYLQEEELQWYLCRILVSACNASKRFQCQVGKLELWNELFQIRSTHPDSERVIEISLDGYVAFLDANEVHLIQAQTTQRMIQELLDILERFHGIRRHPVIIVKALHTLLAIYASPRVVKLMEKKNEEFTRRIIHEMLKSIEVFMEKESSMQTWLQMCRALLQCHPDIAPELFIDSSTDKEHANRPWFLRVLDKWSDNVSVMYAYAAIFTLMFALSTGARRNYDREYVLLRSLIQVHQLLDAFCRIFGKFHDQIREKSDETETQTKANTERARVTLLEVIRLMSQWSAIEQVTPLFGEVTMVKTILIPSLTTLLHEIVITRQLAKASKNSTSHQLVLEILLTLRRLATVTNLHSQLVASSALKATMKQLLKDTSEVVAAKDVQGSTDKDLDALIANEFKKFMALVFPTMASSSFKRQQVIQLKQSSSSIHIAHTSIANRARPVKPDTISIYTQHPSCKTTLSAYAYSPKSKRSSY